MKKSRKIIIIIIDQNKDLKKIKKSVDSINNEKLNNIIPIVATNKKLKNIDVQTINYNKIEEVFFDIPKTMEYDYISFIEAGDIYSKNFGKRMLTYLNNDEEEKLFIINLEYKDKRKKLNKGIKEPKTRDIHNYKKKVYHRFEMAILSKELFENIIKPNVNLQYDVGINMLLKAIILNNKFQKIRDIIIKKDETVYNFNRNRLEYYKLDWYKELFVNLEDIRKFCNQKLPAYIQHCFMKLIKQRMDQNINANNKNVLSSKELEEFKNSLKNILQYIDDKVIIKCLGSVLVNYYLLKLKHNQLLGNKIEYIEYSKNIKLMFNNQKIMKARDEKLKIQIIDYEDGDLIISGIYKFPFDETKLALYAEYNNEIYYVKASKAYASYRVFGEIIYTNYAFDLRIPLKDTGKKERIKFYVKFNNTDVKLSVDFWKYPSKLSNSKYSYWKCGKYVINYRKGGIVVLKNNMLRHIKRELKYISSLFLSKEKKSVNAGILRIIYNLTRPFFKNKEIWIFQDKLYKGGDCGEYMYRYSLQQNDRIKKYYILSKDSSDIERFKKEKIPYLKYNTLLHKLIFLNSKIVFATHNTIPSFNGFDKTIEKYFRDLYNYDLVCIQHGLTVQNLEHITNRRVDNTKLYFLASNVERENLLGEAYDYNNNPEILRLTGIPRYDGLINNPKKQILITPTWRTYLAISANMGKARGYNKNFKEQDYFKIYNQLINNKKLLSKAKEKGYKIIYLLHPITSSQIGDYDKNECVELLQASSNVSYEEILRESDLMVTDYSGVQFDFAYMYKPIIYFHSDALPPSYDEGYYNYETMALGEIIKTEDELVDTLCEYIDNNCEIKEEYRERIDDFFAYHDRNNCKRIYEQVMEWKNNKKFIKDSHKEILYM